MGPDIDITSHSRSLIEKEWIRNFKPEEIYQLGCDINQLLIKICLRNPQRMVISEKMSVPQLLHNCIVVQTYTNNQFMGYVPWNLSRPNTVAGTELSIVDQQQGLLEITEKQNLYARQIEPTLFQHVQEQQGKGDITTHDLINT